jgi:hypothetical protein
VPQVVEAKDIKVSKRMYNMLRSFLESSMKKDYIWNVGVYRKEEGREATEEAVTFDKDGKWTLVVKRVIKRSTELPTLSSSEQSVTLCLHVAPYIKVLSDVVKIFDEEELEVPLDAVELKRTFFVNPLVPFSYPIRLADVIDKMEVYRSAAEDFMVEKAREELKAQQAAQTQ